MNFILDHITTECSSIRRPYRLREHCPEVWCAVWRQKEAMRARGLTADFTDIISTIACKIVTRSLQAGERAMQTVPVTGSQSIRRKWAVEYSHQAFRSFLSGLEGYCTIFFLRELKGHIEEALRMSLDTKVRKFAARIPSTQTTSDAYFVLISVCMSDLALHAFNQEIDLRLRGVPRIESATS